MDPHSGAKIEPVLRPGAAVGAIMVTHDSRYLLQHRDSRQDIFFPGYWGNFGGAIDAGEAQEAALRREILEELDFEIRESQFFCTLSMDFGFAGMGIIPRHFFVVAITDADVASMHLREGQGKALFGGEQILHMAHVAPYDSIAIWQHLRRGSFLSGA